MCKYLPESLKQAYIYSTRAYNAAFTFAGTTVRTRSARKSVVTITTSVNHGRNLINSTRPFCHSSVTLRSYSASTTTNMPESEELGALTSTLKAVGLSEIPRFPETYPEINPADIYRSHITELLTPLTAVEPKVIHSALSWTATLDKGDLLLPVPALRVKGKKPKEFAQEISDKVQTYIKSRY